jgi:hypothetical protein
VRRRDLAKTLAGSALAATVAAPTGSSSAQVELAEVERSAGVVPLHTVYSVTPRIDPRRYGAVGDGRHDDTEAMQTALKVAQAGSGRICIPDNFDMLCGPLEVVISGSELTNAIAIEGVTLRSRIRPRPDATKPLLTLRSTDPRQRLTDAQLILENFSLFRPLQGAAAGDGLMLAGLSLCRVSGVQCFGFVNGILIRSSLTTLIDQQCQLDSNQVGLCVARAGADSNCNLITVDHCRMSGNFRYGVDFSGGTQFVMRGCDLEENGRAGDMNTGALRCGRDLAGSFGYARVELYENWFEANRGQCIRFEPLLAGSLQIAIEGGQIVSSEHGNALQIERADAVLLKNVFSPSPGDHWDIDCNYLSLTNTLVHTLNDSRAKWKDYHNARTATYVSGGSSRLGEFSARVQGLPGGPAEVRCKYAINGSHCVLSVPEILGGSAGNDFGLSGLPEEIRPRSDLHCVGSVAQDESSIAAVVKVSSSGALTMIAPVKARGTHGFEIVYSLA